MMTDPARPVRRDGERVSVAVNAIVATPAGAMSGAIALNDETAQ